MSDLNVNLPYMSYPKYKCNKCNRITIVIGMVLEVIENNIPKSEIEEFHRQYCMYCWRDFFDANVGQLTIIEDDQK